MQSDWKLMQTHWFLLRETPQVWLDNYAEEQQVLRDKIVAAQTLLPTVELDYNLRIKISEVCSKLDVDGLRGDIVTNRAAKAYAAYNERTKVTVDDIATIITLCLRHRLRKDPLESIDSGDKYQKFLKKFLKLKTNLFNHYAKFTLDNIKSILNHNNFPSSTTK